LLDDLDQSKVSKVPPEPVDGASRAPAAAPESGLVRAKVAPAKIAPPRAHVVPVAVSPPQARPARHVAMATPGMVDPLGLAVSCPPGHVPGEPTSAQSDDHSEFVLEFAIGSSARSGRARRKGHATPHGKQDSTRPHGKQDSTRQDSTRPHPIKRRAHVISPARAAQHPLVPAHGQRALLGVGAPSATPRTSAVRASAVRAVLLPPEPDRFKAEMVALYTMGFCNVQLNAQLLSKYEGSIEAVVIELAS